jgi:hemoglobin
MRPTADQIAVRNLVTAFYTRVRRDHILAQVFERAVGKTDAEWAAYLANQRDFWLSVMPTTGPYRGNPVPAHLRLSDLEPAMFERWLSLLRGTCTDLFEPEMASAFQDRVGRIARSLWCAPARNGNI